MFLIRTLSQTSRVLRNVVMRPFRSSFSKFRSLTNINRYIGKIPGMITAIPKAVKGKPAKRSDYFEIGNIFLAKKFIVMILIYAVLLSLLVYFFIWPVLQSRFFTAKFVVGDTRYDAYSGKVIIFYNKEKKRVLFRGRLSDGLYTDKGNLYYENGFAQYDGQFEQGIYSGYGNLYSEEGYKLYSGAFLSGRYDGNGILWFMDGTERYNGNFSNGLHQGFGTLYSNPGIVRYAGSFENGIYHGTGTLYSNAEVIEYSGSFENGIYHGAGKMFDENGNLVYNGEFSKGEMSGWGELYYESGVQKYVGEFRRGLRSGSGKEFAETGSIAYRGDFLDDLYEGQGALYGGDGSVIYEGGFSGGVFSGYGRLRTDASGFYNGMFKEGVADGAGELIRDGSVLYAGNFTEGRASGTGKLSDRNSGLGFAGEFENGYISPSVLFAMTPAEIYGLFSSGMREQLNANEYYLYNSVFGLALRFEYAGEQSSSRLTAVYMRADAVMPAVSRKLADFSAGSVENIGTPEEYALRLTGIRTPVGNSGTTNLNGVVYTTLWLSNDLTTPVLYIFEPSDVVTGAIDTASGSSGTPVASGIPGVPGISDTPGAAGTPGIPDTPGEAVAGNVAEDTGAELKYYEEFGLGELYANE